MARPKLDEGDTIALNLRVPARLVAEVLKLKRPDESKSDVVRRLLEAAVAPAPSSVVPFVSSGRPVRERMDPVRGELKVSPARAPVVDPGKRQVEPILKKGKP